ncbi:DUF2169 domain-containing protein [Myxococcus sp. RHSTA-1-4]|uniref:DUF2169 family type VI secretion system accessory protein n=1 Tax=Myxococcus sp. RHSTA-1-4 TaxID=2874601 RepID=UPI001CC14CDB|nr:DUF2169 domain-containing protein [Myxococcus sp. RHSTA-1-4]
MGFQPDGREVLVVVAKATFTLPTEDTVAPLAPEQVPLTEADTFTGEPGFSAPLHETDFAHRKPRCDVLLNGSAWAPGGRPARVVPVSLSLGGMKKSFAVHGPRVWRKTLVGGIQPSEAQAFTSQSISYDHAFGGVDTGPKDASKHQTFLPNPVGKGFHHFLAEVDGRPMPNTEEIRAPITSPRGPYRPMAFGALGRNWQPRASYAGTYDARWMDECLPFFPKDFDDKYFQAAPEDQQVPYPRGGEAVTLVNLSPQGMLRFRLPHLRVPIAFIPHQGRATQQDAVLDTVLLEPDANRLLLTWRIAWPLRRNAFEMKQVVVGGRTPGWMRAHAVGKKYYPGLNELIQADRARKGGRHG